MPRNGSGTYSLPQPAFVPNTTISSAAVNSDFSDIAAALTQSISADGQTAITGQLKFPIGTSSQPSITFGTDLTTGIYYIGTSQIGITTGGVGQITINGNNSGSGQNGQLLYYTNGAFPNPVGMITDFAGSSAPAGWFLCYGQSLSTTSYPELFQIIAYTYGGSGGSFSLPDCRGRASFGKDNMGGSAANRITTAGGNFDGTVLGNTGGQQNQTLGTGNIPSLTGTAIASGLNFAVMTTNFGTTIGQVGTVAGSPINIGTAAWQGDMLAHVTVTVGQNSPSLFSTLSNAIILNKIIFAGRP